MVIRLWWNGTGNYPAKKFGLSRSSFRINFTQASMHLILGPIQDSILIKNDVNWNMSNNKNCYYQKNMSRIDFRGPLNTAGKTSTMSVQRIAIVTAIAALISSSRGQVVFRPLFILIGHRSSSYFAICLWPDQRGVGMCVLSVVLATSRFPTIFLTLWNPHYVDIRNSGQPLFTFLLQSNFDTSSILAHSALYCHSI